MKRRGERGQGGEAVLWTCRRVALGRATFHRKEGHVLFSRLFADFSGGRGPELRFSVFSGQYPRRLTCEGLGGAFRWRKEKETKSAGCDGGRACAKFEQMQTPIRSTREKKKAVVDPRNRLSRKQFKPKWLVEGRFHWPLSPVHGRGARKRAITETAAMCIAVLHTATSFR